MAIVNWKCPACGGGKIEEVLEDATQYSTITNIWGDEEAEYGETEVLSGHVDRYQCSSCGHTPTMNKRPMNNLVSLYIWLNSHGMLVRLPEGEIE